MYKKYFLLALVIFSARLSSGMDDMHNIAFLHFLNKMENDIEKLQQQKSQSSLSNVKKLLQKNYKEQWLDLLKNEIKQGSSGSVLATILNNTAKMEINLKHDINPLQIDKENQVSLVEDAIRKDDIEYLKAVLQHNPAIHDSDFELVIKLRTAHANKDNSAKQEATYKEDAYLDILRLLQKSQLRSLENLSTGL